MPLDYSKIPTEDLQALKSGDYSKVSTNTLKMLKSGSSDSPSTSFPSSSPEPTLGQKIVSKTGPTLRYGGTAAGGLLAAELGPVGIAGGGSLGWLAGDVLQRTLEDITGLAPHKTATESWKETAKNAVLQAPVEGMLNAFGGVPGKSLEPPTAGITSMRKALNVPASQFRNKAGKGYLAEEALANRAIETGTRVSKAGKEAVEGRLKSSVRKMDDIIKQHPNAYVNPENVVAEMDKIISEASHDVGPKAEKYLSDLKSERDSFIKRYISPSGKSIAMIPLKEAQKIKLVSYGKSGENFLLGRPGDYSAADVEIRHAMERGLKNEINKIIPAMKDANQAYAWDVTIDKAINKALMKAGKEKWSLFDAWSIATPILMGLGAGTYAGGHAEAGAVAGGLAGLGAVATKKLLNNPHFQSILAVELRNAAKASKILPKGTMLQMGSDAIRSFSGGQEIQPQPEVPQETPEASTDQDSNPQTFRQKIKSRLESNE